MVRELGGVLVGGWLAACSGSASIDSGSAGIGGGEAATTSSQGGSTSASVTSGGGAFVTSCGAGRPPCAPDEFCDTPADDCGGAGVCVSRPAVCDGACDTVCACDGAEYCSACVARLQGVDVGDVGCDLSYAAVAWFGGLDHIIISRLDVAADQCTRIYADAPTQGTHAVEAPEPWGVSSIVQYDGVAGCLDWQSQPSDVSVEATSASGVISWVVKPGVLLPCALDVDVTGQFDGDVWAEPMVVFAATRVAIGGDGCM